MTARPHALARELLDAERLHLAAVEMHEAGPTRRTRRLLVYARERLVRAEQAASAWGHLRTRANPAAAR